METINISGPPNNLDFKDGTQSVCNSKLSDSESSVKPSTKYHNSAYAVQVILLVLAMMFLKPQSKPVDLMDEDRLNSGSQLKTSKWIASESSFHNASKLEKVEVQQYCPVGLSIDKKADIEECGQCREENGTVRGELAAFYTHLASRDLQIVLKYISILFFTCN